MFLYDCRSLFAVSTDQSWSVSCLTPESCGFINTSITLGNHLLKVKYTSILKHWYMLKFKFNKSLTFSVTWSCMSRKRDATSSDWKFKLNSSVLRRFSITSTSHSPYESHLIGCVVYRRRVPTVTCSFVILHSIFIQRWIIARPASQTITQHWIHV